MKNRVEGRYALVTGATSGIGEACAKALAEAGCNLYLTGRRSERLEEIARKYRSDYGVEISCFSFDVTDREEVREAIGEILKDGVVDICVNNAGLALGLEPLDMGNPDDWDRMIDTNIKGLLYIAGPVMAHMKSRNRGHMVNIGSIAGETAYPGGNVYCATKSAVHMLSEAMLADAYGSAVKVTTVAPGAVDTEFSDIRFGGDMERRDAVYEGYEPLKGEDIADLVLYILDTPAHVDIQYCRVMPTAQRNPYLLYREKQSEGSEK